MKKQNIRNRTYFSVLKRTHNSKKKLITNISIFFFVFSENFEYTLIGECVYAHYDWKNNENKKKVCIQSAGPAKKTFYMK